MDATNGEDVARYYTRGVRFPRVIGKTADGTRIPGGPYTMIQAVGGLATFIAGESTKHWWATDTNLMSAYAVLLLAVAATVFALRYVRAGGRNPVTVLIALVNVCTQPRTGRIDARPVRLPKAHRVTGAVNVLIETTDRSAREPALRPAPEPASAPTPPNTWFAQPGTPNENPAPAQTPAPPARTGRGLAALAGPAPSRSS